MNTRFEMHALTLLKQDHKLVEGLFKEFTKTDSAAKKKSLVQKIIKELSVHAAIEEQVFYPAIRKAIESAEDDVLEALEEHHIVKWVLSELESMGPEDERFDAKVKVLCENVSHHVDEEEDELFEKVRKHMDRKALTQLGEAMLAAKKVAPKRPHPRAPDTPPGNLVAGLGAGLADRARDSMRKMMKAGETKARAKKAGAKKAGAKKAGAKKAGAKKRAA